MCFGICYNHSLSKNIHLHYLDGGRYSGNDFFGYLKALFTCRLVSVPTQNEARIKSCPAEATLKFEKGACWICSHVDHSLFYLLYDTF